MDGWGRVVSCGWFDEGRWEEESEVVVCEFLGGGDVALGILLLVEESSNECVKGGNVEALG